MGKIQAAGFDLRSELNDALVGTINGLVLNLYMTKESHGYAQQDVVLPGVPTTSEEARKVILHFYGLWDDHVKASVVHATADTVNTRASDADADTNPVSRALAIKAANAFKGLYNAHRVAAAHYAADGVNIVTAADAVAAGAACHDTITTHIDVPTANTLDSLQVRTAAIYSSYSDHVADATCHENADPVNVFTVPSPHVVGDTCHQKYTPATSITAATTYATAKALANGLVTAYTTGGHLNDAGVHLANDATNAITAASATGAGETCHDGQTVNVVTTAPTDYASCKVILNTILKPTFNAHMSDTAAHKAADVGNQIVSPDATTDGSANTLANEIKVALKAGGHINEAAPQIHWHDDATTTIAAANSSNEGTCVTLVTELLLKLNAHMNYSSERSIVLRANDIKAKMIAHATKSGVHDVDDTALAAFVVTDAINLTTAYTLLDAEQVALNSHYKRSTLWECMAALTEAGTIYNAHRSQALVHWVNDAGHAVTSPDATDLATAYVRANEMADTSGDLNNHYDESVDLKFLTLAIDLRARMVAHIANASTLEMIELSQ